MALVASIILMIPISINWFSFLKHNFYNDSNAPVTPLESTDYSPSCSFILISDSSAAVSRCHSSSENISIPQKAQVNGYECTITIIGEQAFRDRSDLKNIEIPNSVESIEISAFENCFNLKNIEIPDGVTYIGGSAFSGCSSLETIKIPSNIECIEYGTFYDCSNLTNIDIPDGVESIGNSAFYNCTRLTSIKIPANVKNIEAFAFCECINLTNIEIPENVTNIGEWAFYGCINLDVVIDNSKDDVVVGEDAFRGCKSVRYTK